jgi:hypothetical protein
MYNVTRFDTNVKFVIGKTTIGATVNTITKNLGYKVISYNTPDYWQKSILMSKH